MLRSMFMKAGIALCMAVALGFVVSCISRPLPIPPTIEPEVDPDKITIESLDRGPGQAVRVAGGAGAIDPPGTVIRVTCVVPETPPTTSGSSEITTEEDGSFEVNINDVGPGICYFEALLDDEDLFFAALRSTIEGNTIVADPGPDADGDGSPDAIDCAPDDDAIGGQRCSE